MVHVIGTTWRIQLVTVLTITKVTGAKSDQVRLLNMLSDYFIVIILGNQSVHQGINVNTVDVTY